VQDSGELNKVYQTIAKLIHAETTEAALCESTTVAWNLAFYAMVQRDEQERKKSSVTMEDCRSPP